MSLKDFILLEKLGSGSFATVHKVRRLIDQEIYAMKKIDMKALSTKEKNNALNQIRLLACLKSPYIISYCQSFFDEKLDLLCVTMEYADGGDLLQLIQKHKKSKTFIPELQIWKIFVHLLYGLNLLHSRNILHRDLKSENVFISNRIYKIGDMNVSKIIKNGLAKTQTGTPYYASPEVWNDQAYNQKSDIWSLGCILFEVAALKPPFESNTMESLFNKIIKSPTPKIPGIYSKQLQTLIDKCLEKNPLNRPNTQALLSNPTIKIYENLLIQFKPSVQFQKKQPLLKTIYMPSSKKQLKNKLPQSNYKSSSKQLKQKQSERIPLNGMVQIKHSMNQNLKIQCKSIKDLKQRRQKQVIQDLSHRKKEQNKENITSTPKLSDKKVSQRKVSILDKITSSKQKSNNVSRNRIGSCQIFNSNKQINIKEASSQKNQIKEKLKERAQKIINSQKCSNGSLINLSKVQPKAIFDKVEENQSGNKSSLQHKGYIEQMLKQKQLNSPQGCQNSKKQAQRNQVELIPKRLNFDLDDNVKGEILQKEQKTSSKDRNQSNAQTKVVQQELVNKENEIQVTAENASIISADNHRHYNFDLNNLPNLNIKNQLNLNIKNQPKTSEKDGYQQQNQNPSIKITVDVNQKHFSEKINKPEQIQYEQEKLVNLYLSTEKVRVFIEKMFFKLKLISINNIRNVWIKGKISQHQLNQRIIQHQQSKLVIKQLLQQPAEFPKLQSQKSTQYLQSRTRTKSIPKTERPKYHERKVTQIQKSEITTQKKRELLKQEQKNSNLIKDKINEKLNIESLKQKSSKKIFQLGKDIQSKQNNKFEQMLLIPTKIYHGKLSNHNFDVYNSNNRRVQTDKKVKRNPLLSIQVGYNNQTSSKEIQQNQRKRKIFQNCSSTNIKDFKQNFNPIHVVNDKLDKINLQKKFKQYMNI